MSETAKSVIQTPRAPAAIGPYAQAIRANGVVYCSGQIAIDPATGEFVRGSAAEQTQLAMENLGAVLAAAGSGFEHVLRTTIFVTDMREFEAVNAVYATFFKQETPARACVEVRGLPKDAAVELDAIALVP